MNAFHRIVSNCLTVAAATTTRARAFWTYVRRVSGDDAYERYVAHLRACHPDRSPLSARDYFRQRHEEKWTRPSRCC